MIQLALPAPITVRYLVTDENDNPPVWDEKNIVEVVNAPAHCSIDHKIARQVVAQLGKRSGLVWRVNDDGHTIDTSCALRVYPSTTLWFKWRGGQWRRQNV